MTKVAVFTGAGISKESGIATFRCEDGIWTSGEVNVDEVATITGWNNDPQKVLDFHNKRREELHKVHPNDAHKALAELEQYAKVTIVTQNIDDLHERAGSTDVIHIHGELLKCRSSKDPSIVYQCLEDLVLGEECELGSQLKPDTVLFGEYPLRFPEAFNAMEKCDYLIIVGTSFEIGYTSDFPAAVKEETDIYYVDPDPRMSVAMARGGKGMNLLKSGAVDGVRRVTDKIIEEINN